MVNRKLAASFVQRHLNCALSGALQTWLASTSSVVARWQHEADRAYIALCDAKVRRDEQEARREVRTASASGSTSPGTISPRWLRRPGMERCWQVVSSSSSDEDVASTMPHAHPSPTLHPLQISPINQTDSQVEETYQDVSLHMGKVVGRTYRRFGENNAFQLITDMEFLPADADESTPAQPTQLSPSTIFNPPPQSPPPSTPHPQPQALWPPRSCPPSGTSPQPSVATSREVKKAVEITSWDKAKQQAEANRQSVSPSPSTCLATNEAHKQVEMLVQVGLQNKAGKVSVESVKQDEAHETNTLVEPLKEQNATIEKSRSTSPFVDARSRLAEGRSAARSNSPVKDGIQKKAKAERIRLETEALRNMGST